MRAFFILIAALVFGTAWAGDLVFEKDGLNVRISAEACKSEAIAAFISRQIPGKVGAAVVTFQGQEYMACWASITDAVVIVDESCDGGYLPLSGFKPAV